jgi:hypothetical protein
LNLNVNGTALQFKELVEKATGIAPQSQKLFGLTKGALKVSLIFQNNYY